MTVKHRPLADQARKSGQWVVLRSYPNYTTAHTVASQIRNAGLTAYAPAGSFEPRVSRDAGQGYRVSVRYLGS